jgi:hypothetical protein
MSDNFHYANNIKLPGKISDLYTVVFRISPPRKVMLDFIMIGEKRLIII